MKDKPKPKQVWIAFCLNLIPILLGLGYLYLGKPIRFFIFAGLQLFMELILYQFFSVAFVNALSLDTVARVLLWIISLIDIVIQTRTVNRKLLGAKNHTAGSSAQVIEEPDRSWECPRCKALNPNTSYVCGNCQFSLN